MSDELTQYTPQEILMLNSVAKYLKKHNYTGEVKPEEVNAVRRVELIEKLGFPVTTATIDRELSITRAANVRVNELVAKDLQPKTISMMEG